VKVVCRKKRFRDEIAAKLALATVQHRDNPKRPRCEQRAYYCKPCRRWHLTSMPRGH